MAVDHDPGSPPAVFVEALRAVRRFPDSAFEPYKLSPRTDRRAARPDARLGEIAGTDQ
jgi:hypothetical protein